MLIIEEGVLRGARVMRIEASQRMEGANQGTIGILSVRTTVRLTTQRRTLGLQERMKTRIIMLSMLLLMRYGMP